MVRDNLTLKHEFAVEFQFCLCSKMNVMNSHSFLSMRRANLRAIVLTISGLDLLGLIKQGFISGRIFIRSNYNRDEL